MNWPKYRDGISQIGQSGAFTLETPGTTIGKTGVMNEIREDGTPGTVRVKRMGEFVDVRREAGPKQGLPFLSTWQAPEMSLLDKYLPRSRAELIIEDGATLFPVGNCKFLGGGFSVGVARVGTSNVFVVLLVRLPRPGAVLTADEYRAATESKQRSSSVRFDPIELPLPHDVYVVPMGWDGESQEYKFAFVAQRSGAPLDVWVGGSVSAALTKSPSLIAGVESNFPNYSAFISQLYCTAPGRLEAILAVDDNPAFADAFVPRDILPFIWRYTYIIDTQPGAGPQRDFAEYGWPTGNWAFVPRPPWGHHADVGSTTLAQTYTNFRTFAEPKPGVFFVRSNDFGRTWVAERGASLEPPVVDLSNFTVPLFPGKYDLPGPEAGFTSGFIHTFVNQQWNNTLTIGAGGNGSLQILTTLIQPAVYPSYAVQNRGVRDPLGPKGEAVIVGAGQTTFVLCPAFVIDIEFYGTRYYVPRQVDFNEHIEGPSYRTLELQRWAPRMFRRIDGSPPKRIDWPGDRFMTSPAVNLPEILIPKQPLEWDVSYWGRRFQGAAMPRTLAWGSTGEGRAAFFFINGDPRIPNEVNSLILMIATIDGGDTWVERTILNSYNFRESCLIAADKDDGCSFLYAEFKNGMRQLKRISSDLTTVTDYGKPYPAPQRPGLINFQRHVHPGFPGIYDGPKEQPR